MPHSFPWSPDGGHAGRTGSDSQGHAPRSARDGVSAAFTITNLVIVGNWDSNNTVFTMHTLPVGQPPDCGAQFRSVPRHALVPFPLDRKSTRLNSVTNAHLVCRLLLEKKKQKIQHEINTRQHTRNYINT